MKVVAFLPAKGTSSRIECKNIKLLDNKPLFLHTLEKLCLCDFIDEVYLDSESQEIFDLASYIDCKHLVRSPNLASNATDGNKLFMNEVNHVEADIYIQVLGTSPFISPETIQKGVEMLQTHHSEYDSVVLVRREKFYLWDESGKPTYDINNIPNSFQLADTIIETMGLYIIRREAALKMQRRIGERPFPLCATPIESIDVNYPEDFELANMIAIGKRQLEASHFQNLKSHLSSAMLSDVLNDMGYHKSIIRGLDLNLKQCKFLGRARTLRIRKLHPSESMDGIYKALDSYKYVVHNDVLVVENEVGLQYAYFGELNANLSVRANAAGAIIGGLTRDSEAVKGLGFPVCSKGISCCDVRGKATVDHMNKPVTIEGVLVQPNQLIFADSEGIVVIPIEVESELLDRALLVARNEKQILIDIALGTPVQQLTSRHGNF